MKEFIIFINPDDVPNGRGSISIYEWDSEKNCPKDLVLKKEYSIDVWSDPQSLIEEGRYWFKKNEKKIIEELEEKGYEDVKFFFGI